MAERPPEGKIPQYNAKKTVAVTERVLRSWCGVSNAYLWNVENCQQRIAELCGPASEGERWFEAAETAMPYATVSHDNLMYGMETSLKAAQMIDGYHGFNRDLGIPGFIENFQDFAGLTYVYIYPTHRLDRIYREFMSSTIKRALGGELGEHLDLIYRIWYPDEFRDHWAPGSNYKEGTGDVLHDSVRYTRHWIGPILMDVGSVMRIVQYFRWLNEILPDWFRDPELKIPGQ